MKKENPAARESANRVSKALAVAAICRDPTPHTLAAQHISRKFGLTPAVAALVAELAGMGEKAVAHA